MYNPHKQNLSVISSAMFKNKGVLKMFPISWSPLINTFAHGIETHPTFLKTHGCEIPG